jgi:hypothetical protein
MKKICFFLLLVVSACSLPPERPVSKEELYQTGVYNFYSIDDAPEAVLAALNRDGEVVVAGKYREQPIYIKILAGSNGLKISSYER